MRFLKLKLKKLCTLTHSTSLRVNPELAEGLNFALCTIIFIGVFLRFYGLNWGLPYPFHPDERNMAVAITRFSSKTLNPEFYAYGQFPLYLAYFTGTIFLSLLKRVTIETLSFTQAILLLRFWSAFFSTATIYIVYLISKKLFPKKLSSVFCLLSSVFVALTPSLIQSAHFGTTESVLTFCFLAIIYFSLKILEKPNSKNYFWLAFFLGIALGSKISAIVFAAPLAIATIYQFKKLKPVKEKLILILKIIFTLTLTLILTLLASPYLLLAYKDSRGTLLYEIAVAQGQSLPFYTRQFFNTTPILFQLQKIFPYALGLPLEVLGIAGFLLITIRLIFRVNPLKNQRLSANALLTERLSLITLSFLAYFVPNVFLFTKWTRFMTPVFPFFAIFSAYFLGNLGYLGHLKKILVAISIVPGLIFFSLYLKPDIRFTASEWIYQNIPSGAHVLSETANVVDIPIPSPNYPNLPNYPNYLLSPVSFDFYSLDENPATSQKLLDELVNSDYIFVPSRRLFANNLRLPEKYPLTAKYYQLLFSGKLGFQEIKKFSPFPNFSLLTFNFSLVDERSEETYTVFDHPVIRIYKKATNLKKEQYETLFK